MPSAFADLLVATNDLPARVAWSNTGSAGNVQHSQQNGGCRLGTKSYIITWTRDTACTLAKPTLVYVIASCAQGLVLFMADAVIV